MWIVILINYDNTGLIPIKIYFINNAATIWNYDREFVKWTSKSCHFTNGLDIENLPDPIIVNI